MRADRPRRDAAHDGRTHETSDIQSRGIVIFLIALAVVTILVLLAMRGLFVALENRAARADRATPGDAREARDAAEAGARTPTDPLLQASPAVALAEMRAAEEKILSTYAWMNADLGTVRIPIDRAIELLAERGLPTRGSCAAYAYVGDIPVSGDFIPRDANSGRGAGAVR